MIDTQIKFFHTIHDFSWSMFKTNIHRTVKASYFSDDHAGIHVNNVEETTE